MLATACTKCCWSLRMHLFIVLFVTSFAAANGVWPMPKRVEHGSGSLYLDKNFKLKTDGSKYLDASGILKDGFSRMLDGMKLEQVANGGTNGVNVLECLHVLVSSPNDELNFGIDESYKLFVPDYEGSLHGRIEANTVFGALHGIQTFSQLCQFNFTTKVVQIQRVPWVISDRPRFPYRGLLIDTSRHYQPLSMIKNVIDAMAYTKLNVLHWHIVDTQSFPIEIPSYPKLWNGAYSASERYTMTDALEIVQYAKRQGINVMVEIDVPGHALSWGVGYPQLWPSTNCHEPLDVSNEFTFKVIDGILSDFIKVFNFKFIHLGGDEVDTSCWSDTPHVNKWMRNKKISESDAYKYFVLRAQNIAISHGYEIFNWEETFNDFGSSLSPKTVVHNWLGAGVAQKVVAKGLRCVVSNQDSWYLDHLSTRWEQFYLNEPLNNITNPEQKKLVIGGEVCMWGETVDGSNIQQTIWPRAAAAAERLWSPLKKLKGDLNNMKKVERRLANFRCLLNQRGVEAAPFDGSGRAAPDEPGSCYLQ